MDEEIDRLVIGVRADTAAFRRDVEAMRGALDGPLEAGAERAGRAIEGALARAVRTGKLGFDDLKRVALSALAEIAAASVRDGMAAVLGGAARGSGGGAGGLLGAFAGLVGGWPGRATGGPVSPGRAYLVGERGPELFVPTGSGRVMADASSGVREVRVAITVNAAPGMGGAEALTRSGRQVARAVRRALGEE